MNHNYYTSSYYQNSESSNSNGEPEKPRSDLIYDSQLGLNLYQQQKSNNYHDPMYYQYGLNLNYQQVQECSKPKETVVKYGNAYLGGNLWDHRNDFFLSEKQFTQEYQNKSDMEFMEHLQSLKKDGVEAEKVNQNMSEPALNSSSTMRNNEGRLMRPGKGQPWSDKEKFSKTNIQMNQMESFNKSYNEGSSPSGSNHSSSDSVKDDKYWSRRKKNNMAAKKSRDARRVKESQLIMTATVFEIENAELKKKVDELKKETETLRERLKKYEWTAEADKMSA